MLLDAVRRYGSLYLRLALAAGFLASVTDRLGLWGRPGTQNVSWGNLQRFMAYTAQLNPWAPTALIPAIAWFVTVAEDSGQSHPDAGLSELPWYRTAGKRTRRAGKYWPSS
jgi:hypothetical protein